MVELLVAVLVLGIGILGMAGLQVHSLQQNRAALMHGEAVHLAYDIVDRIRANPTGDYARFDWDEAPPNALDCTRLSCDPDELAAFDQAVWKCHFAGYHTDRICDDLRALGVIAPSTAQTALPGGDGRVIRAGDVLTVSVRWQDAHNAAPAIITVQTQL
jgi:type IV pilus assembly protein PilV